MVVGTGCPQLDVLIGTGCDRGCKAATLMITSQSKPLNSAEEQEARGLQQALPQTKPYTESDTDAARRNRLLLDFNYEFCYGKATMERLRITHRAELMTELANLRISQAGFLGSAPQSAQQGAPAFPHTRGTLALLNN